MEKTTAKDTVSKKNLSEGKGVTYTSLLEFVAFELDELRPGVHTSTRMRGAACNWNGHLGKR